MLSLISPAKNLDLDSAYPTIKTTQPEMLNEAQVLIEQMRDYSPQAICALMKLSDKLGQLNYDRFQAWKRPFNKKNARPSIFIFAGGVYQGLDAHQFSEDELQFAQDHLRILSGLYGLLRPLDLMQAYRLEMGTRLQNSRGKDLYAFWGQSITEKLNDQLKKTHSSELINLASNEYFKSVKTKNLKATLIEPVFKDWKNGQYKIISFFAKKARGLMSAYIIKNKILCSNDLMHFDTAGYSYNKAMSTQSKLVFTRKQP